MKKASFLLAIATVMALAVSAQTGPSLTNLQRSYINDTLAVSAHLNGGDIRVNYVAVAELDFKNASGQDDRYYVEIQFPHGVTQATGKSAVAVSAYLNGGTNFVLKPYSVSIKSVQ